jgi:oligoribonuclease
MAFLRTHIPGAHGAAVRQHRRDRRFARWFPEIEDYLRYRSVDVTLRARPPLVPAVAAGSAEGPRHRALDDIRESLDELRYYRGALFHPAAAAGATPVTGPAEQDALNPGVAS